MASTYAWASYVLALDYELARFTKLYDYVEFVSRIAISGWNSRFWTYQEYCMARVVVYEGDDGPKIARAYSGLRAILTFYNESGSKHEDRAMGDVFGKPFLGIKNNEQDPFEFIRGKRFTSQYYYPASIPGDLVKLTFRPHFDMFRYINGPADSFTWIWNLLRDKSTTKSEDVIFIFANLLAMNAIDLQSRKLSEIDRMKAVLKSFAEDVQHRLWVKPLPLDLLFVETRRYSCNCTVSQCTCSQQRWIPLTPEGADELGGLKSDVMALQDSGLRFESSRVFHESWLKRRVVRVLRPVGLQ